MIRWCRCTHSRMAHKENMGKCDAPLCPCFEFKEVPQEVPEIYNDLLSD